MYFVLGSSNGSLLLECECCYLLDLCNLQAPSFSDEVLHSLTAVGNMDFMWHYPQSALDAVLSSLAANASGEPTVQAFALWHKVLAEPSAVDNLSTGGLPLYETICKLLIISRPTELVLVTFVCMTVDKFIVYHLFTSCDYCGLCRYLLRSTCKPFRATSSLKVLR